MNKTIAILDFDGNLIDSMPAYTETFSEILFEMFGISVERSSKYFLNSAGTLLDTQFKYVLEKNDKPIGEIEQMVEKFFNIVNQADYSWYQGAKELIEELHRRNFTLFVSTGSQTLTTERKLKKAEIAEYFELILGSGEIPKGPKHIEKFIELAALSPEEFSQRSFCCGDGARDMEIAGMFGIYAIGVAQTVSKKELLKAGADVAVDRIEDVIGLDVLK